MFLTHFHQHLPITFMSQKEVVFPQIQQVAALHLERDTQVPGGGVAWGDWRGCDPGISQEIGHDARDQLREEVAREKPEEVDPSTAECV